MKTVLITGANKSIGFETARQLLQQGYFVYLGSRDIRKGRQSVSQLHTEGLTQAESIEIDVDQIESIRAARKELGRKIKVLDVLINNAGIGGKMPQPPLETDISVFRQVFETNFFGVIEMTQSFIDLLKQSPEPRIVMTCAIQHLKSMPLTPAILPQILIITGDPEPCRMPLPGW